MFYKITQLEFTQKILTLFEEVNGQKNYQSDEETLDRKFAIKRNREVRDRKRMNCITSQIIFYKMTQVGCTQKFLISFQEPNDQKNYQCDEETLDRKCAIKQNREVRDRKRMNCITNQIVFYKIN